MIREKRRYILVESGFEVGEHDRESFAYGLYDGLLRCLGETGYHRVNPKVVDFVGSNRFIMRSSLSGAGSLVAARALLKRVNGKEAYFYTLKSSGTIRALSKFEY